MRELLDPVRKVQAITTGAYIIKTYDGLNKLEGVIATVEDAFGSGVLTDIAEMENPTLKQVHQQLQRIKYMGAFTAYEQVTDLRHTAVLENAPDIDTWASAGPGAARGLDWVFGGENMPRHYGNAKWEQICLDEMAVILLASRDPQFWPKKWRRWELREVEHTLCEYDKWKRGHAGMRLKRTFAGSGSKPYEKERNAKRSLDPTRPSKRAAERLRRKARQAAAGLHGNGEGTDGA